MARPFQEMTLYPPTGGPKLRVMMNRETGEITRILNAAHYREFSPSILASGSVAVDGGWQKQATVTGIATPLAITAATDGHTGNTLSITGHSAAVYQSIVVGSGTNATTQNFKPLQLKKGVILYTKIGLPEKLIHSSTNNASIIAGFCSVPLADIASWDGATINMGWRINSATTPGSTALRFEMDDNVTDTSIAVNDPATNSAFSLTNSAAPGITWYHILLNALDYQRPVLYVNNRAMQLPALPVLAALSDANGLVSPGITISSDQSSGQTGSVTIAKMFAAQATH